MTVTPAGDSVATEYQDKIDRAARAEADAKAPAGEKGPPSWAKLEEMATKFGARLIGPIRPGRQIASAGIDRNGRRLASCQAMDWDEAAPDRQDRILRAQLGAALWAIGGG